MSWDKQHIIELLLQAGDIARKARRNLHRQFKSDESLVTQADTQIETCFTEALENSSAGRYVIGEETINYKDEDYVLSALSGETFVVDPIDGTVPFAHFLPNWGVSVGYMKNGHLLHGGVYLPDYGEMMISSDEDGFCVIEGREEHGQWAWNHVRSPQKPLVGDGLVAITQSLAKKGQCLLPNTVMALGTAVVPLLGIAQGRFLAYLGSVKLWDVAGALPILLGLGLEVFLKTDGSLALVTTAVDEQTYELTPGSLQRWHFQGTLMICHQGDADLMSKHLVENCPESSNRRI